jgi:hypothetical protein
MTTLKERIAAGRAEASHDDKPKMNLPTLLPHLKQRGGRLINPFVAVALAGEPEAHMRRKQTCSCGIPRQICVRFCC